MKEKTIWHGVSREEKVKRIYEVIANKELTLWCKIMFDDLHTNVEGIFWQVYTRINWDIILLDTNYCEHWYSIKDGMIEYHFYSDTTRSFSGYWYIKSQVLWHPVMIWDVLDRLEKNLYYIDYCGFINDGGMYTPSSLSDEWLTIVNLLKIWKEKRKPIESQQADCIDFVYELTLLSE